MGALAAPIPWKTCPKGESFHHLWERCAEFRAGWRGVRGCRGGRDGGCAGLLIAVLACLLEQRPGVRLGN